MDVSFLWNVMQTVVFLAGFLGIFWKVSRMVFQNEHHEKQLDELKNTSFAVVELTKDLNGLGVKLSDVTKRHESRMSELESHHNALEMIMARIETKLDDVIRRLDRSEK